MLVLTRSATQQIVIGDQKITITVLEIKGGRVRLGIDAPSDVVIRRKEVVDEGCTQPSEETTVGVSCP